MSENEKGLERLSDLEIADFCEQLWTEGSALKSLAFLLKVMDVKEGFTSDDLHGWGEIIEICAQHQEQQLKEMRQRFINTYEYTIHSAKNTYDMVRQGAFANREVALENINAQLVILSRVITEAGNEYPQAQSLMDNFLETQRIIQAKGGK